MLMRFLGQASGFSLVESGGITSLSPGFRRLWLELSLRKQRLKVKDSDLTDEVLASLGQSVGNG